MTCRRLFSVSMTRSKHVSHDPYTPLSERACERDAKRGADDGYLGQRDIQQHTDAYSSYNMALPF